MGGDPTTKATPCNDFPWQESARPKVVVSEEMIGSREIAERAVDLVGGTINESTQLDFEQATQDLGLFP